MRLLIVAAVLIAGCVTASDVVPVGNGRFMITARASGGLNAGKEMTKAAQDANAYCAHLGKRMVLADTQKTGNAAVFGENVTLYFTCE